MNQLLLQFSNEVITLTNQQTQNHQQILTSLSINIANLQTKLKQLQSTSSKIDQELLLETQKTNQIKQTVENLKNQETQINLKFSQLNEDNVNEQLTFQNLLQQFTENQRKYQWIENELNKGICKFQKYLGLHFESIQDSVKVIFTLLDRNDPYKQFYFTIAVRSNYYEVENCQPKVSNLNILIERLNLTNDLAWFIRQMRKSFQQTLFKI
eukprot:TRINITY_DN8060_c0_g1_i1.p1 TRINITY_DN8060_c0_g1~~TRINITY_DN8060_c0_g1_i1.p1  ORF type:complete len:235 (+),score=93.86 TRINITY_DN8060_c0_g1_i1:73-705(+)